MVARLARQSICDGYPAPVRCDEPPPLPFANLGPIRLFINQPVICGTARVARMLFSRFHHMRTVRSYVRPVCAVITAGLDEVREAGSWIKGARFSARHGFRPVLFRDFVPWFIVWSAPHICRRFAGQLFSASLRLCSDRSSLDSCWVSINSASRQQCPDHPSYLIGERNRHDLEGPPRKHVLQPRPDSITILYMTQHRCGACRQQ